MKLSIIIPVYNSAPYLNNGFKHLKEIYNYLHLEEFEIIYINDGATDNSGDILEKLAQEKQNIRVIHQKNQGSSEARNVGIKKAKGDYLIFIDADDSIIAKNLISLIEITYKEKIDILGFKIQFIDMENNILGEMNCHNVSKNKIQNGTKFLIEGFQPSSACQFIYKRLFLLNKNVFFHPITHHEDVDFTTRLMIKAEEARVLFTDVIVYNYTQIKGSKSKPKSKEKIHKLLYDEILVAELIKKNVSNNHSKELNISLQKNYNSVIWNLLWRFYKKPKEVDPKFKETFFSTLKEKKLYPIKGSLKTPFQNITRIFMNNSLFLKKYIIRK